MPKARSQANISRPESTILLVAFDMSPVSSEMAEGFGHFASSHLKRVNQLWSLPCISTASLPSKPKQTTAAWMFPGKNQTNSNSGTVS